MPLFYRIENEQGHGMYRSSTDLNCTRNMQGERNHPSPYDDKGLHLAIEGRRYVAVPKRLRQIGYDGIVPSMFNYGFADLDQLERWVYKTAWRRELKKMGFMINVYKCKKAAFAAGDTQAVCLIKEIKRGVPNRVLISTREMDAL